MSEETRPATVHCARYQQDLPAITTRITFAGEFGERILKTVSQQAWSEWLDMQIKVINEYRLHLGEAAHRQFLKDSAARFFRFDGGDGSVGGGAGPEGGLT